MDPRGRFKHLTNWVSKLPGAVARITGGLHCARHAIVGPQRHPISAADTQAAIQLGEALEAHALAAFDLMGAGPDLNAARVRGGPAFRHLQTPPNALYMPFSAMNARLPLTRHQQARWSILLAVTNRRDT